MFFENKKGNLYAVAVFLIFFLAVWAFWLGAYLQEQGEANVTNNNLTGVEAFFWENLNLVIAFALLLAAFIYFKTGGGA